MFFSNPGEYEACGIFTKGHLALFAITTICIVIFLKNTVHKSKSEVKSIIKNCTVLMWLFELVMIVFKISVCGVENLNHYVPLYYCSILLYAGLLSSFSSGKLKRTGDVFLSTGGIVGGIVYLILPTTSLPTYPMFHLVSVHSFLFHGIMVYLGLLMNLTSYVDLKKEDIKYYASLVGIICLIALIFNILFDCNLMFISKNFPGMPIEIIYNSTGVFFTPIMIIAQMTVPFMLVYEIIKMFRSIEFKNENGNKLDEEVVLH